MDNGLPRDGRALAFVNRNPVGGVFKEALPEETRIEINAYGIDEAPVDADNDCVSIVGGGESPKWFSIAHRSDEGPALEHPPRSHVVDLLEGGCFRVTAVVTRANNHLERIVLGYHVAVVSAESGQIREQQAYGFVDPNDASARKLFRLYTDE